MKIADCRPLLEEIEFDRLVTPDVVTKEAISSVEQDGIVFIDEIDKIVSNSDVMRSGADASSEGVQCAPRPRPRAAPRVAALTRAAAAAAARRDLLPIIEGCAVSTKYGTVNTDHILFICSGAFHSCKPSDMMAELQGRLPIRVELRGLSCEDLYRILTVPEHSLLKQQQALLATEGMGLTFDDDAIREMASVAHEVNRTVDNIGARRLHTILERILDDISFSAPERVAEHRGAAGADAPLRVAVHRDDVRKAVGPILIKSDLSKFVL